MTRSSVVPDWDREKVRPGSLDAVRRLLHAMRIYQRHERAIDPFAYLQRRRAQVEHRMWSSIAGCTIPITTQIDGGLVMPHPNGVRIDGDVRIGPNCEIGQNVTIGPGGAEAGAPVLEGGVKVGHGASIVGAVRIGQGTEIEPNTVVTTDVPPGSTVAGVPAVIERPADR